MLNSETLDHYELLQEELHLISEIEEESELNINIINVNLKPSVDSPTRPPDAQIYMNGASSQCKLLKPERVYSNLFCGIEIKIVKLKMSTDLNKLRK